MNIKVVIIQILKIIDLIFQKGYCIKIFFLNIKNEYF